MKLHKIIKQKLAEQLQDTVIKQMGYGGLKVGRKTLKAFINSKNVYEWLKHGHYDLKYASEPFVWKLVEVLGIPTDIARVDIEKAKRRYESFVLLKDPSVDAITDFKRSGQSIFSLMLLHSKIWIRINKERFVYKTDEEIFENVGKMIRKHYAEYKGELPVFGKISYYLYDHTDGKTYKFTIEGKLLDESQETKERKQC